MDNTCPRCHGRGHVDCTRCHGKGLVRDPETLQEHICPAGCDRTSHDWGQVDCPNCGGLGSLINVYPEAEHRSGSRARSNEQASAISLGRAVDQAPQAIDRARGRPGLFSVVAIAFLALYIISPIDILPDVIPVLGWIDDLAAVFAIVVLVRRAMRGAPKRR